MELRSIETLDSNLDKKAQKLRAAKLFVGGSDLDLMTSKQNIFLALAGLKPVGEASSGHWHITENGRDSVADDPKEVAAFLDTLGLHYQLRSDEVATDALVALRQADLDAYSSVHNDHRKTGIFLGYPATAVEAFVDNTCIPGDEQAKIMEAAGIKSFFPFRFSQDHWREELPVIKSWYTTLKKYQLT